MFPERSKAYRADRRSVAGIRRLQDAPSRPDFDQAVGPGRRQTRSVSGKYDLPDDALVSRNGLHQAAIAGAAELQFTGAVAEDQYVARRCERGGKNRSAPLLTGGSGRIVEVPGTSLFESYG